MPAIVGTISGPSTVTEGTSSTNFTIDNTVDNPTYSGTLTMSDGGFGGTFTPATLTWTGTASAKTFVYNAPSRTGLAVIMATNGVGDSTVPSTLNITVTGATTTSQVSYQFPSRFGPPPFPVLWWQNQVPAADISPSLFPGVITNTGATSSTLSFTATDATGGYPPYSYQWAYRLHGIGSYANFGTDAITTQVLTGLTASTAYDIQLTYTDSASNVVEAYLLDVTTQASATSGNIQNIIVIPQGLQATGTAVKLVN